MDKIFKVEAVGDTLYFKAPSLDYAKKRLWDVMGSVPEQLLKWTEVKRAPKGEEIL
jgi:hypothetical protein